METAADLRAAGATWETAARQVGRDPTLLMRWARHYREEWQQLYREAEERLARRASDEARAVLRTLFRAASAKVRRAVADKLAQRRHDEKAREAPSNPKADRLAYLDFVEKMSDEQLQQYLLEFVADIRADGGDSGAAKLLAPQGSAG